MILTISLLLLMSLPIAGATKPTQIAGKFRPISELNRPTYIFSNIKVAGANGFFTQSLRIPGEYYDGLMDGTFTQSGDWTVHFGDPLITSTISMTNPQVWPAGDFIVHVDRTFTGSVGVASGTLTMRLEAKGHGTIGGTDTHMEGTWVILSGTGGLANLHGQGTWRGPTTNGGIRYFDYDGLIHFDST